MSLPLLKTLIIHTAGGIGDLLLSTCTVEALHQAHPDCQIDFLCQHSTAAALYNHPLIKQRFEWPERNLKSFSSFLHWIKLLRSHNYDAAIVLWSTTQVAWLIFLAGIPIRVGKNSRLAYSFLYTHKVRIRSEHGDTHSHWSEILLDHIRVLGLTPGPAKVYLAIPEQASTKAKDLLTALHGQGPLLAFHPFKGPPVALSSWPLPIFAEWIKTIRKQLGARIVITASMSEKPYADKLISLAGADNLLNLAGQTDLATLAAISQQVDAFICPDSGPMHVAAAAGARVLGIYALEEEFPQRWAPLSSRTQILRPQPTACHPGCRKATCRNFQCYQAVSLTQLLTQLQALLLQE